MIMVREIVEFRVKVVPSINLVEGDEWTSFHCVGSGKNFKQRSGQQLTRADGCTGAEISNSDCDCNKYPDLSRPNETVILLTFNLSQQILFDETHLFLTGFFVKIVPQFTA